MLDHTKEDPDQPPSGSIRPEWLDWPNEKITQALNEYASQHDTTLDPALAGAQTRTILEN